MIRVYVAAPLGEFPRARAFASRLRRDGIVVTSRWHDALTEGAVDPVSHEERKRVLYENFADLARASVVVALVAHGDPRCTYYELGRAGALDKFVLWVEGTEGQGGCLGDAHHRAMVLHSEDQACTALQGLSEMREGRSV